MTVLTSVAGAAGDRGTILKLQVRLLPFLLVLYVVAFIDRINLGFAALTMNRELAITSQQFGLAPGLAEAGYFPGIVLYLGYWFPQQEKAKAIALILVGIPLASVLGSPISGF